MSDTVGKEYLVTMTGAALGLAHCLLGIGVLMFLFMLLAAVRQCLQKPKKPVPLPTPPIYRRKPSCHTVYPPTPPISRQQMSIYAICRPTPPESPLASIATFGGKPPASPSTASLYKPFLYLQEPRRCSLQFVPPHRNGLHNALSLSDRASYHHQQLRSTWSLPGRSYQLLES